MALAVQVTGVFATSGYPVLAVRLLNVVTDGGVQTASFDGTLTRPAPLTAVTTK